MDEILIEDKKYISSRRAAKATGYAKDYIGQLCREGRVPARLIGRNWYVLETAIQDHRFGNPDEKKEKKEIPQEEKREKTKKSPLSATWDPPRYETLPQSDDATAPINLLRKEDTEALLHASEHIIHVEEKENIRQEESSWETWFNRFDRIAAHTTGTSREETKAEDVEGQVRESIGEENLEEEQEIIREEVEINIPIHTKSHFEGPIPEAEEQTLPDMPQKLHTRARKRGKFSMILGFFTILIFAGTACLVFLNSGYMDKYLMSFNQDVIFIGISVYNK